MVREFNVQKVQDAVVEKLVEAIDVQAIGQQVVERVAESDRFEDRSETTQRVLPPQQETDQRGPAYLAMPVTPRPVMLKAAPHEDRGQSNPPSNVAQLRFSAGQPAAAVVEDSSTKRPAIDVEGVQREIRRLSVRPQKDSQGNVIDR